MNVYPFTTLQQNYNEIADICRQTQSPVYLTVDGMNDTVVMDIKSFTRCEKMLQLRENLLAVEEDRAIGRKGCSIDELGSFLNDILNDR